MVAIYPAGFRFRLSSETFECSFKKFKQAGLRSPHCELQGASESLHNPENHHISPPFTGALSTFPENFNQKCHTFLSYFAKNQTGRHKS